MAIAIDWGQKIIDVPKADMELIQSAPAEIRRLDVNTFRLALKGLEDGEDGMAFPLTHNHQAPVSVGGVTLARVVELVNNYTVTFEDGQYAVNLTGANSNIADRANVNQVSVRSANSAGLVQVDAIEPYPATLKQAASLMQIATIDASNVTPTRSVFESSVSAALADVFKRRVIVFADGACQHQAAEITAYSLVNGRGRFTVTEMAAAPANGDRFVIL